MAQQFKRLYRSRTERQIAGICGGIGLFFDVDPVLIRLALVAATCLTGFLPGIIAYLLAWIIVPEEPYTAPAGQPADRPNEGNA
jgi:phage shock protein C